MITILPMKQDSIKNLGLAEDGLFGFAADSGEYCVCDGTPSIIALAVSPDTSVIDGLVRAALARAVRENRLRVFIGKNVDKQALLQLGFIDNIKDESINVPLVLGRGCKH